MSAADLEAEVRRLRAQIATLTEEATINEKLFRKNRQRELEILNAPGITQLFDTICHGLLVSYGLERVTLLLCDPQHEIRHLLLADRVRLEDFPAVLFIDTLHALAPQLGSSTQPWLGPYRSGEHQRFFPGERELGSVALIPLARQDRLQGSLNFGSRDPQRFTRHLGTDFLAQLGAITTFAIENTLNRSRLLRSGLTDFLTGWHNRRYLQARLREELARAVREGSRLACVIVDIDHFKEVNDRYGHLAGDAALRETARRIDGEVRGSDASARYGGDEFGVLIPVEAPPGRAIPLTVSVGGALVQPGREQGRDLKTLAEGLVAEADAALYRAKQRGRNRIELAGE